jgi:putative redox protein
MDVKVTLLDGMHLEGTASSGHKVFLDSSEAAGGKNEGFRPTELLAVGTAGCTAMDVASIMRKKKVDFTSFEVRIHVESETASHPHVFKTMRFEYIVTGRNIVRKDVERAVQLSEEKYCPAIAMMRKSAEMSSIVTINQI